MQALINALGQYDRRAGKNSVLVKNLGLSEPIQSNEHRCAGAVRYLGINGKADFSSTAFGQVVQQSQRRRALEIWVLDTLCV